ncbi:MAG: hypothetical protein ACLUD0_05800 [Eubacterium ramulus]
MIVLYLERISQLRELFMLAVLQEQWQIPVLVNDTVAVAKQFDITASGNNAGGFAGIATLGWGANLEKEIQRTICLVVWLTWS